MRLVAVIAAIIFLELIMETLQLHRYQQGSSMAHLKAGAELIHVSNSSLKASDSMLHKSRTSEQFDEPTTSRFLWESRKAIDRQDFQNPVKHLNLLQYLQSFINAKDNTADDSSLMTNSYHPTTLSRSSPYAYAFLLVGCNPANPSYLGFLFNILVSAQILREQGSQADIVVMVRMSGHSNATKLPPHQIAWLDTMGVKIRYVPKRLKEHFMESQMIKFRILQLVQYRRVLYLDSDVMPLCNLDYIFKLSDGDRPIIKENLVVAWTGEPANGGFFMLEPGKERFDELLQIIKNQREQAKNLPYPHFDETQGWGHPFGRYDVWEALGRQSAGQKWDFYAAYVDQGLLYHYVKYARKSVTIIVGEPGNLAQNWHRGPNNTAELENTVASPFEKYTCRKAGMRQDEGYGSHPTYGNHLKSLHPYSDYTHFYAKYKPWATAELPAEPASREEAADSTTYWFFVLRQLNRKLGMEIDFNNWTDFSSVFKTSPLGSNRVGPLVQIPKEEKSAFLGALGWVKPF